MRVGGRGVIVGGKGDAVEDGRGVLIHLTPFGIEKRDYSKENQISEVAKGSFLGKTIQQNCTRSL